MALYVNTNVSSLNGQRMLTNATNSLNTTYQRLSSGLRINSAKDDAAGLQISDRLTSQINGLNQGNRNANDGIALAQTVEGAMEEMTTMLQRIRTLALQSANGTNTQADRDSLQKEVLALSQEISRISVKTTFNGEQVLAGKDSTSSLLDSKGNINFQVGAYAYDTLAVDLSDGFSLTQMTNTVLQKNWGGSVELEVVDLALQPEYADMSIEDMLAEGKITQEFAAKIVQGSSATAAGGTVAAGTGTASTVTPPANTTGAFLTNPADGTSWAAASTDFDNGDKLYITKDNITEIISSASENDEGGGDVAASARTLISSIFGIEVHPVEGQNASGTTPLVDSDMNFDVSSYAASQATLKWVDEYLMVIDSKRADLGAIQNRMESTIRNQSSIAENTTDARSRIRDTDFAQETANLSAQTILQQSSQTVLSQANQRPQIALALLGG